MIPGNDVLDFTHYIYIYCICIFNIYVFIYIYVCVYLFVYRVEVFLGNDECLIYIYNSLAVLQQCIPL